MNWIQSIMIEDENLGKVNEPFFADLSHTFAETLESGWHVQGLIHDR